ncbi:MAG TPA: Rid family hydrolase, partial [Nitrososphaerales archaeon]|nr:Rid family hydrolase [Nitrososphaerales archaeon]
TAQTKQALDNLAAVLEASGLQMSSIVKTTVFLSDMSNYQAMNEEYSKHFASPFPARTTVQAAALPRGALVEIDAIASH